MLLPHPSRGRDKDGISTGTNRDTRNATRNARTIGRRVLRFATEDPFVLVSDSFSCVASVSIDRADDTRRNAVYCSFSRGSHCSLRDRNTSRSGLKLNLLLGFVRFEGRCIFVSFSVFQTFLFLRIVIKGGVIYKRRIEN